MKTFKMWIKQRISQISLSNHMSCNLSNGRIPKAMNVRSSVRTLVFITTNSLECLSSSKFESHDNSSFGTLKLSLALSSSRQQRSGESFHSWREGTPGETMRILLDWKTKLLGKHLNTVAKTNALHNVAEPYKRDPSIAHSSWSFLWFINSHSFKKVHEK